MRPSGSPQELERRRVRGLRLLRQGLTPVEVARQLGVDRRSVRRWKSSARRRGEAGVRAKPASGRPRRLGAAELKQLRGLLLQGARAAGLPTDLWTCPRVAWLIKAHFGVRYHEDHIGRVLHGLGFSPQKPTHRAAERDEERIRQWVQQDWPKVKKTPRA